MKIRNLWAALSPQAFEPESPYSVRECFNPGRKPLRTVGEVLTWSGAAYLKVPVIVKVWQVR